MLTCSKGEFVRSLRLLTLLALLGLTAGAAHAAPSAAQREEAKRLFEKGKEAMSVGRFAEAREHFQRSVDLVPKASAAFNLAVALRGTGQPKEARDVLKALLRDKYGRLPAERRSQVRQLAEEARADVAQLTIAVRGVPRADVRVDGTNVGKVARGKRLTVEVNPGERMVTLSARLRKSVERKVTVAPGKIAQLSVKLPLSKEARRSTLVLVAQEPKHALEIVGVAKGAGRLERRLDPGRYTVRITTDAGSRDSKVTLRPATRHRVELDPPQSGLLASPWFWVASGAVVVGATVGGYFLLRRGDEEPVKDPEFGVVETLEGMGLRF